jgi:hypothetical protein
MVAGSVPAPVAVAEMLGIAMNTMFIFVVCFGVLVLGVIIATSIFNARVGGSSQPAPWMRRVRRFQNERENAGWRIRLIPYCDTSKPMTMDSGGIVSILPMAGVLGFIGGLAMATYDKKYESSGLMIAVLSFVVLFGGALLKARVVRQGWDVAPGRCVDRELQKVWMPVGAANVGGHWGWFWRIICEYEYLGIPYRVTPEVYWADFNSEEAALKFLEERISPNGECTLRVDPKNPLRTELMNQGIKDKLLY